MVTMKCPYCKSKGARVDSDNLAVGDITIHSATSCKKPLCTAYDPILFGPHPSMSNDKKMQFEEYLKIVENESDFDLIIAGLWRRLK